MRPSARWWWKLGVYTALSGTLLACEGHIDDQGTLKQAGLGGGGGSAGHGGSVGNGGLAGGAGLPGVTAAGNGGGGGSIGSGGNAGASGSAGSSGGGGQCKLPPPVEKVFFGTTKPTFVQLSDQQILSIGLLDLEGGVCSATLVKRDWVLTAAHCTEDTPVSDMHFRIGTDPGDPDREYSIAQKYESEEFDTTLLKLTKSPLDDSPTMVPIRINDESLSDRIGDTFEGAGYGLTEDDSIGTRYFTAEPLIGFNGGDDEFAEVDGDGKHGLCGGDSGGPLLGKFSDGSVRVVGDLTGGDDSCVGVDNYTRTDVQIDWIKSVIGSLDSACDTLDPKGVCDGNTVKSCQDGELKTEMCDEDEACKLDSVTGRPACVLEPCAGIPPAGLCNGTRVRACRADKAVEVDCATCGMVCSTAGGTAECVPQ